MVTTQNVKKFYSSPAVQPFWKIIAVAIQNNINVDSMAGC